MGHLADNHRFVFVAQTYAPATDGTAVLIRHLAEQFAADGDEVHVITSDALGPAGFRTLSAERVNAPEVEDIRGVCVHRLPTHWWLSAASRPVQAIGRRLRLPGAERAGDLYMGPAMRGLRRTLDEIGPTAVYASAFPCWHMHQLAAWGEHRGVPVVLHGAIHPEEKWAFDAHEHPEIVPAGVGLRRQHRLRGPVRGRSGRAARPDHCGRSWRRCRWPDRGPRQAGSNSRDLTADAHVSST